MLNKQESGNKNVTVILIAVLLCAIFYFVYDFSMKDLQRKRADLLSGHQKNMEIWVNTSTKTAERWLKSMDANAQDISSSKIFRLFVQEMLMLDTSVMKAVQESDTKVIAGRKNLSSLEEQMPLMRTMLRDYVQAYNLIGARIVSPDGSTIIASMASSPPLTAKQRELVSTTIKNNKFTMAQIVKSLKGLIAEYAVPLSAVVSEDAHPMAVLLISTRANNAINTILAGTPLPNTLYFPYLLQAGADGFAIISDISSLAFPLANHSFEDAHIPFDKMQSVKFARNSYVHAVQIPGYPFWIALEMSEAKILDELNILALRIYALAFAICVCIGLFVALLWWIIVGREQKAIAQKFRNLYHTIKLQNSLLDGVNSSLQVGLALMDKGGSILLSNEAFEKICGKTGDLDNITKVFVGDVATEILLNVQSLEKMYEQHTFEVDIDSDFEQHLYRITLYAYSDNDVQEVSGAVCIFQDITEFRRKKIEMQNRQRRVIEGLLNVVEDIDPYLSGHSSMLQKLAVKIAERMDTSEKDIAIVNTAAYFSQIGKFYIPRDILLKTGKLTEEEVQIMRQIPGHAFAILKNMDFGMPIAEVVYQMYENMDGSGYPQGLVGRNISLYARIITVANIFLALTSPRSYRHAFDASQALEQIAAMKDKFDDDVVAILFSIVHDEMVLNPSYKKYKKKS